MLSNQDLSDLIGAIYDCALDPGAWPRVMRRIVAAVEAKAGACVIHDLLDNRSSKVFDVGFPPGAMRLFTRHYGAENPIAQATFTRQEGDVDTLATLFHDDRFERSATRRVFFRGLGLGDVLQIGVLRNERRGIWFGAVRAAGRGLFGPEHVAFFRLLAPHVVRTMRISDMLELRSIVSERLAETLDALASPVLLLGRDGRVLHRNEAAAQLLEQGRGLHLVQGRLVATHRPAEPVLAEAIARMLGGDLALPGVPHAIPLGDGQLGQRAIATLLPLGRHGGPDALPGGAAGAVFVQDPDAVPALALEAFGGLYRLTAAELRFLGALANAASVREAAAALGIGEQTGKSHLKSIFAKTGTTRQAELARLLGASASPLRRG